MLPGHLPRGSFSMENKDWFVVLKGQRQSTKGIAWLRRLNLVPGIYSQTPPALDGVAPVSIDTAFIQQSSKEARCGWQSSGA